ncbi:response regulator [Undibacterium cyanobacteriorum]|uniref:Response regulator n=1 Tax=Undibacterium cyanobacteriorum TaxID=3073561 RepID=A0ABY9RI68_9BURK|nr:response regulator [Undibacterium sp. 20NA77.5]WMW79796.1 response regulator [Undibacterium sp. 20NA77.5]
MQETSLPQKAPAEMRVLVVDDDPLQLAYVAALLKALAITNVHTADNGTAAIEILDQADLPLDLIISDLMMPTMDGFDFLWQLAYRQSEIPVIIMSAQTSEVIHSAELVAQLKFLKLVGSLHKPVSKESFFEMVKPLLL